MTAGARDAISITLDASGWELRTSCKERETVLPQLGRENTNLVILTVIFKEWMSNSLGPTPEEQSTGQRGSYVSLISGLSPTSRTTIFLHHGDMTYPRAHLVDQINGGYYHCVSRCVRQSWLCGKDRWSGRSFEHRRDWICRRINHLSRIFAIDIYAYAVMSNHYHVVLKLDPQRVGKWSDNEVADRWLARHEGRYAAEVLENRKQSLITKTDRLKEIRKRLGSLSWFMREINEPLARAANLEDGCTGRFWEGRFKSIALLDHTALLACMIYVDLNPVRASSKLKIPSDYTSAQQRLNECDAPRDNLADLELLSTNTNEYVQLLRWTNDSTSTSLEEPRLPLPTLFTRLNQSREIWIERVALFQRWYRAYGCMQNLLSYTKNLNQKWLQLPELRRINAIDHLSGG